MTTITPKTSKLDIVDALENYITNKNITNERKVYFSGEYDSNQTKFERASNDYEVGVIANNHHIGRILLRLLRIIIDDNIDLFDLPFEIRDEEEEENRQDMLYAQENPDDYSEQNPDEGEQHSDDEGEQHSDDEDEDNTDYDLSLLLIPFENSNDKPMNINGYVRRFQEGSDYITSLPINEVFNADIWDMPRILTIIKTILSSNTK